jgi:hypothetical protein
MITRKKEGIDMKGKHLPALFVIVFLILTGISYGDETPHNDIFNEYINSPEGNAGTSVDKNASPTPLKKKEDHKKSEKPDTKKSLQEIPSKDRTCAKDSDCTAGVADCVSWEPLNKKYVPELLKHSTSCSASIDPGFQPVTVCADKVCRTTDKFTDSSWDDWLNERIKP